MPGNVIDHDAVDFVDLQLARDVAHDPFEALDAYRDREPFWAGSGDFHEGGFWVVGKFDQCREVLQDAELFPSEPFGDEPLLPTMAAPPELQKLRKVLLPHLSLRKMMALEGRARELASYYIDKFADTGSCDVVKDFAQHFPIAVFSELFGLQDDRREEFRRLAETWLHSYDERRPAAWAAIREIVRVELDDRRGNPRDDLLTGIANGTFDDQPIDPKTCVNLAATTFLGGLDTLPSNIGWAFRHLATHPAARRRVSEDPACIPMVVEEFLRLYPVVAKERRLVARDIEFHGVQMRAGDRVVALVVVANRDDREFDDPQSADFDRKVNRHLSFGAGPHRCIGSHLARLELAVTLEEWHARIPDYRLDESTPLRFNGGIVSVTSLPLLWEPTRNVGA